MENTRPAASDENRSGSASTTLLRLLGVFILLAGLYGGYQVVERAWILFEKQDTIVRFAEEIDKHSHLNAFVSQFNVMVDFVNRAKSALPENQGQGTSRPAYTPPAGTVTASPQPLNASYLLAWMLTIILLALIARISFWAITAGGKLALFTVDHEQQLRLILRQLIAEVRAR